MNKNLLLDIITTDYKKINPIGIYELFRGYLPNEDRTVFAWSNDYVGIVNNELTSFLNFIVESSTDGMLPKSAISYLDAGILKDLIHEETIFCDDKDNEIKVIDHDGFVIGIFDNSLLVKLNEKSNKIYIIENEESESFENFENLSEMVHLALSVELINEYKISRSELFEHINNCKYRWLDADGNPHLLANMETSHLYYTLRMVWNHIVPIDVSISPRKEYDFSLNKSYTISYFKLSAKEILCEINQRNNLSNNFRENIRYINENIDIL
jgi:hypothetical protein